MFDTDSGEIGIDNRCSACLSNIKSDFHGPLVPCNCVVRGFGGTTIRNVWNGTLRWVIEDDDGRTHVWLIPGSYYVPDGGMRLLSPQHWAKTRNDHRPLRNGSRCITNDDDMILQWKQRQYTMTVPVDPAVNVGTFHLAPGYNAFHAFSAKAGLDDDNDPVCFDTHIVSDGEDDDSLSSAEGDDGSIASLPDEPRVTPFDISLDNTTTECTVVLYDSEEDKQPTNVSAEFLRYHHKFNHISFAKLRHMAKQGIIPKHLAKCPAPACSACLYGKATRKPWRSKQAKNKPPSVELQPGDVVSVDQMKSPTAGLITQMSGFLTKKRYRYATVFVCHGSDYGYVHIQKTQSAEETIEAKIAFERTAAAHGVKIGHYHADNGVFASEAWKNHCRANNQGFSYAGVSSHHQNGRAERRIRELQDLARTMLIHAQKRWSAAINAHLWPYAVRMANDAHNEAMGRDGKPSPIERFSQSSVAPNTKVWQPFGCPVYVLEDALQTVKGMRNKWKTRSKIGVYLGRSPFHARSVALVLNLKTGYVSPQFHVAFDPCFQSVKPGIGRESPPSLWQSKCFFEGSDSSNTEEPAASSSQQGHTTSRVTNIGSGQADPAESRQQDSGVAGDIHIPAVETDTDSHQQDDGHAQVQVPEGDIPLPDDPPTEHQPIADATPEQRSSRGRAIRAPRRLIEVMLTSILWATSRYSEGAGAHTSAVSSLIDHAPVNGEIFCQNALFPDDEWTPDEHPLQAFGASNDPDTLYHHEAMRANDSEQFKVAMEKEFGDQLSNGNFVLKHISEVPKDEPILPSVWAMRRKRKVLTGEIYKWKARLNLNGSKQNEEQFWQTYCPCATWSSIRLQLIMALQKGWHTMQLDFVQAYPQAPISKVQYMKLPKGIAMEGIDPKQHVLEIHKNIYGGRDAGRTWYLYLKDKLVNECGFRPSKFDECVFYRGKAMYVLYTDDSILSGPDKQELEKIVEDMKAAKLELTVEGDVSDFLGVNIQRNNDGSFVLTQPKLIDSILEDLWLDKPNTTTKSTPAAASKLLSRHPRSEPFDGHFNYRRAIGKLNFLEKSTRADITYATHQCARFMAEPKREHGNAVKWIGRYLLGTRDKDLILRPDASKGLEIYVDADWAGNWDKELAGEDADTARSRHGYVIMDAGCPILWQSELQSEISLSSTESELIGLSMALRTGIPILNMLNEMKSLGYDIHPDSPRVLCKLFEDNNGALEIARVPKMRPRTKHINCKYFHFVEYTNKPDSPISLHRIDTENQPADTLTKANNEATLEKHRRFILGW